MNFIDPLRVAEPPEGCQTLLCLIMASGREVILWHPEDEAGANAAIHESPVIYVREPGAEADTAIFTASIEQSTVLTIPQAATAVLRSYLRYVEDVLHLGMESDTPVWWYVADPPQWALDQCPDGDLSSEAREAYAITSREIDIHNEGVRQGPVNTDVIKALIADQERQTRAAEPEKLWPEGHDDPAAPWILAGVVFIALTACAAIGFVVGASW